jgi:hypothetical protein
MQIQRRKNLLVVAITLFLGGCAAYVLDSAQIDLRNSFAAGDFVGTVELVNNFQSTGVYEGKDAVLMNLEMGSANHFAGNYRESNQYFESAEYEIEDLYTKSITRAIKSFLVNDNILAYDGEDYEDVYLNAFKTLNYIHLGNLEAALVESRRMSYKLSQLNFKYNDIVSALAEADTSNVDQDKWKTGETNIQNSAMGHYLSTILYAKTGKVDDSRISYNKLISSYSDQPSSARYNTPSPRELQTLMNPNSYNVLIKAFTGRSPSKSQNDIRLYFEEIDTYLKYSLPELELYDTSVASIRVTVNGEQHSEELKTIEHLDLVAREVYKVKEPIIYARTIVRASLKAAATNAASKEIEEENELLGQAFNFLGKVAQEATEKADLRSWQTMPGKSHGTVLKLPNGTHTIEIEYLASNGLVLHSETQEVVVESENDLALVESIYWN